MSKPKRALKKIPTLKTVYLTDRVRVSVGAFARGCTTTVGAGSRGRQLAALIAPHSI